MTQRKHMVQMRKNGTSFSVSVMRLERELNDLVKLENKKTENNFTEYCTET
jgi:hypothetical protein